MGVDVEEATLFASVVLDLRDRGKPLSVETRDKARLRRRRTLFELLGDRCNSYSSSFPPLNSED